MLVPLVEPVLEVAVVAPAPLLEAVLDCEAVVAIDAEVVRLVPEAEPP